MESYNEWITPDVIAPATTSESFTLDFKNYRDALKQQEFKILLNNRWGVKVCPYKEQIAPRPVYVPSSFDVVTGRQLDVQTTVLPTTPATSNMVDGAGRYQSFSLLIQPIPTRFELDEMCNLWDRDVTVYFDLHIGGNLLQPYIQGDTRGQIRSLNRQEQRVCFRSGPNPKVSEWLHICSSSTLFDSNGLFSLEDFRIILRIDENRKRPETSLSVTKTDAIRRESFGARLLDPKHGDVVFQFSETFQSNLNEKSIYASSDLLCNFCPYFKQFFLGDFSNNDPQSLEFQVKYDTDPNTNITAMRTSLSGNRKVVQITNAGFTDYHNILYYIYTGSLNLRYPPSNAKSRPLSSAGAYIGWDTATTIGFPRSANANEIYRLAGIMGLKELQTRAYHFLMSTCSVDNIFDRLFDPYCKASTHAPVRGVYQQFLAKNWDKIRSSGQWANLLRRYRATKQEDEAEYLLQAICDILNAVTWDHKWTSIFHHK